MKKILSFRLLAIAIAALLCGTSNAQIILNSDINVASQRSVDGKQYHVVGNKHYPYKDTANFLSTIPKTRRHVGEISYIFNSDSSVINIWQFVGGIENNNLVNVSALYYKKPEVDSIIDNSMVKDITWGVIDSIRNAPSSPVQGDRYLVSTTATGTFAGKQNLIATYDTTAGWQFQSATQGDLLFNSANYNTYKWTGSTWVLRPPLPFNNWWRSSLTRPGFTANGIYGATNPYSAFLKSNGTSTWGIGKQVFEGSNRLGNDNIAIGNVSQHHNWGDRNISMGTYSLWYNVIGHDQVAIGYMAAGTGNQIYSIGLGTDVGNRSRTFSISDSTTGFYQKLDTTGTAPLFMVGRNTDGYWKSYRLSNILGTAGAGIFIPLAEKGQPNGVPNLDASGKVPVSQLPALTVNQPSYVQHLSDMLSSGAVVGDIVVVGDSSKSYALMTAPASTFSNWLELQSPVPTNTDLLPEGSTNKYYTDIRSRNAISGTGRITYNNSNGQIGVTAPDWSTPGDILNKPTIPAELTPVPGNNIAITGTSPTLRWDVTGIYTKTQSDSISTKIRGEVADSMQSVAHLYPDVPGYKKFESIGLLFPNHVRMNSGLALYGTMDASSGSILAGDITSTNYKLSPTAISFYTTDSLPHGNKVLTLDETTGDFKYGTIPTSIGINDGLSTDSTTYSSDKINSLISGAGGGGGSNNPDSLAGYKGLDYLRKTEAVSLYEPIISTKNTAFNKNFGTTAGTVSEGNHTHTFASITSKPTTIGGYGITDGITKSELTDSLDARMQGDTIQVVSPMYVKHGSTGDTIAIKYASATDTGAVKPSDFNNWNGKLSSNGNGSALTGLTKSQVGLGNVDNTSDVNKPISAATQTALNGKANSAISINTQTANYTLVLADGSKLIRQNVATANTVTVPPNSSVAYPVGTQINIVQAGAGQVTITPGSGVTINSADSKLKTRVQFSTVTLIKTATDTWLLMGDITN